MLFFQRIADIKTYGYNVMTGGGFRRCYPLPMARRDTDLPRTTRCSIRRSSPARSPRFLDGLARVLCRRIYTYKTVHYSLLRAF